MNQQEIAADAREQVGHQGEETTRDGSVDWNGMRCVRAKSGGWFAGFLILRKFFFFFVCVWTS